MTSVTVKSIAALELPVITLYRLPTVNLPMEHPSLLPSSWGLQKTPSQGPPALQSATVEVRVFVRVAQSHGHLFRKNRAILMCKEHASVSTGSSTKHDLIVCVPSAQTCLFVCVSHSHFIAEVSSSLLQFCERICDVITGVSSSLPLISFLQPVRCATS